jgi:uncharacterized protein (TIGR02271 family)
MKSRFIRAGKRGDTSLADETGPDATEKTTGPTASVSGKEDDVVRLFAEELSVEREHVETGRVRVRVVTREHEEEVDLPLMRERVEVERVPIGRDIEAVPPNRQEGETTVIPVVEEVVVVQRKLVLKEELHVRRVRTTEQYRETVVLRRQEAVIERVLAESPEAESKPG